ncbi:MAG: hypothetical protein RR630_01440 [Coprobacillus sp.]
MKRWILLLICVFLLYGCQTKQEKLITLSFNDNEYVEYGSEFNSQTLVKDTNGEIKEYPLLDTKKIGKQVLTFQVFLDKQQKSFEKEIEVKDTKKPIIELHKDKVTIEYKSQFKVLDYIKSITDEIDGDITYKPIKEVKETDTNYYTYKDDVQTDKAGSYKVNIIAVDVNGNKESQDIGVTVKEQKVVEVVKKVAPKEPVVEETKPVEVNQKDYSYVLPQTIEKTNISKKVNKIVTYTSTSYASKSGTAQYFVKENGKWVEKMKTAAIFGSRGMGQGAEGSKLSPIGIYYFEKAYGLKGNPGSRLSYTQINDKHYWCGEQFYNQFIDESVTDHSGCSKVEDEHLVDYPKHYNYFATFHYNSSNTPGKGAAYFMHCKYSSSTAGCIAVAENQMIYLLKNIDTSTALIIDQVNKVENY